MKTCEFPFLEQSSMRPCRNFQIREPFVGYDKDSVYSCHVTNDYLLRG